MREMFVEWTIGFKTECIVNTSIKNKHVKNLDGNRCVNSSQLNGAIKADIFLLSAFNLFTILKCIIHKITVFLKIPC